MSRVLWLGFNEVLNIGDPNTGTALASLTNAGGVLTLSGLSGITANSLTSGLPSSGLFTWGRGQAVGVTTTTAQTYNALISDYVIINTAPVSGICNLITPAVSGLHVYVKNLSVSGYRVVTPSGNIDGGTLVQLSSKYDGIELVADGTNWNIIGVRPAALGL